MTVIELKDARDKGENEYYSPDTEIIEKFRVRKDFIDELKNIDVWEICARMSDIKYLMKIAKK